MSNIRVKKVKNSRPAFVEISQQEFLSEQLLQEVPHPCLHVFRLKINGPICDQENKRMLKCSNARSLISVKGENEIKAIIISLLEEKNYHSRREWICLCAADECFQSTISFYNFGSLKKKTKTYFSIPSCQLCQKYELKIATV
jgi:hypothetical protein